MCRHGAIRRWMKCSDTLGDMIQLRRIMYQLLRVGASFYKAALWWRECLVAICFIKINQFRVTVEPFISISTHWKSYNPSELLYQASLGGKKKTHSYLVRLQLPHQCCQSSWHFISEAQTQPATCRRAARCLRESRKTNFAVICCQI